ncbi:MAG: SDR family oxidoreductase [Rhizobiaceae bacterium]|nr:MAG: SDR family oxidoreductase [Rhizobiaceae bacterium]
MNHLSHRFDGKVALVTAAGNGIGAACARRLSAEGASVAMIDLDAAGLEDTAREMSMDRFLTVTGDCTDGEMLRDFHGKAVAKFGPADILVNNVGQSARRRAGAFHLSEEEVWRFVIEVSLMATMRLTRLVAPSMRERGGAIVNMSSDAAFVGDAGLVDYATAKMGLVGFTRALARELAPHGVTVNAVAPGAVRTKAHDEVPKEAIERIRQTTPAGFVAEPEDVAGVVSFLASQDARFITGQTLLVDGGRWMI